MPIEKNKNGLTFADWIYATPLWESFHSYQIHDSVRDSAVKSWRDNEDPVKYYLRKGYLAALA